MKFLISKNNLNRAINNVQRAISSRSPIPALTGILFQCYGNSLKLSATDTEMSIHSSVPAQIIEPGELVIPGRHIAEFSRKLPDLPIEFQSIGGGKLATVRYGLSEFNVNSYSSSDFPIIHMSGDEFSFSISSGEFKDIIRKVIYATSNDDSRPVFNGVLLEIEGDSAAVVATDTFRLALRRFKINPPAPKIINVVVPGKALNEAVRVMDGGEEVRVTLFKNHIMLETEDTVIKSRLISGKFPAYRQVIPQSFECVIRASIKELAESADRASLLTSDKNLLVMLQSTKKGVVISVRSESGWIREDIMAHMEGENLDIFFNVRYLNDALRSFDGDMILIKLTGPYTPALLTIPEDEDYLSIIVPARTSRE